MYIAETKIRVRYGETDQMGVVYHGNYALYFETVRTESLRQIDVTYRALEESGIMMPVVNLTVNYKRPAKYDDLLTLKAIFKSLPTVKTIVDYEMYNEQNELLCTGQTTLVFVDMKTNKVTKCPQFLLDKFTPYFK